MSVREIKKGGGGQGLSIYHGRNMKTEHNNGANTQGFNCYSDSPVKQLIKSFYASRISQQQMRGGGGKEAMLSAGSEAPVWWVLMDLSAPLTVSGQNRIIFLRVVLTNILTAFYCHGWIELEMWLPLDGVAKQRFVCARLAVHLCTWDQCELHILCANCSSLR